jgi:hypothetical protein
MSDEDDEPDNDAFVDDSALQCFKCNTSYTSVWHLRQHWQTKHRKVFYVCAEAGCGKSYGDPSTLRKHVRIAHEGVKVACIEPGCGKEYRQRAHMLRHYAAEHLKQKVACDVPGCKKGPYRHADALRRHKRKDHADGARASTADADNPAAAPSSANAEQSPMLRAINDLIDVIPQHSASLDRAGSDPATSRRTKRSAADEPPSPTTTTANDHVEEVLIATGSIDFERPPAPKPKRVRKKKAPAEPELAIAPRHRALGVAVPVPPPPIPPPAMVSTIFQQQTPLQMPLTFPSFTFTDVTLAPPPPLFFMSPLSFD